MGDPFFHLGFTRRLRFYDGLHPFAVQTLVRQPLPAAVTAALPGLPALDQEQAGFFKRLLGRGRSENLRWERRFAEPEAPHADYLLALLRPHDGALGAMFRMSATLGALSQRVLLESTRDLTEQMEPKERRGVERGAGRIWLQMTVPSLRELSTEWRIAAGLDEPNAHQKILSHVSHALQGAYGETPDAEMLVRWVRAFSTELRPLSERGGLPPQGAVPEHEVRSRFFEGDGLFLERVQRAIERFVFLANALCNTFMAGEPDVEQIRGSLIDDNGSLRQVPERFVPEANKQSWREQVSALRAEALVRGRNPKPAYYGTQDIPPLPDDASGPHLGARGGFAHAMPPVPKLTQELSLADVEHELSGTNAFALHEAPEETQPISPASIEEEQADDSDMADAESLPPAPAVTQALSLEDIEEEISHATHVASEGALAPPADEDLTEKMPVAPALTQALSIDDIEEEVSAQAGFESDATDKIPAATALTQSFSLEDVEAEISNVGEPADVEAPMDNIPAAPAMTQALSLEDIEEEIAEHQDGSYAAGADDAAVIPAAPAMTQALSLEDIEEEIAGMSTETTEHAAENLLPTPVDTQSVALADIEEEAPDAIAEPAQNAADADSQRTAEEAASMTGAAEDEETLEGSSAQDETNDAEAPVATIDHAAGGPAGLPDYEYTEAVELQLSDRLVSARGAEEDVPTVAAEAASPADDLEEASEGTPANAIEAEPPHADEPTDVATAGEGMAAEGDLAEVRTPSVPDDFRLDDGPTRVGPRPISIPPSDPLPDADVDEANEGSSDDGSAPSVERDPESSAGADAAEPAGATDASSPDDTVGGSEDGAPDAEEEGAGGEPSPEAEGVTKAQ